MQTVGSVMLPSRTPKDCFAQAMQPHGNRSIMSNSNFMAMVPPKDQSWWIVKEMGWGCYIASQDLPRNESLGYIH